MVIFLTANKFPFLELGKEQIIYLELNFMKRSLVLLKILNTLYCRLRVINLLCPDLIWLMKVSADQ